MEVQDPLKALDRITQADPRHDGPLGSLERLHANLDTIRLQSCVPLHVRQLFETAKNLSLYSWFAFRFHPVAKLMGYASLERALKERAAQMDYVIRIADSIPYIRNHIAHGGPLLDGGSVATLRVIAEAINQLFGESKVQAGN